jgi:hypothetical protein
VIGPAAAAIEIKVHGSALAGFGVCWLQLWLASALAGFSLGLLLKQLSLLLRFHGMEELGTNA